MVNVAQFLNQQLSNCRTDQELFLPVFGPVVEFRGMHHGQSAIVLPDALLGESVMVC